MRVLLLGLVLCLPAFGYKVTWGTFKDIVDENASDVYERSDADNLSYRLRTRVAALDYECNVMKSPPDNAALVAYQTDYQPTAKTGGE